MDGLQPLLDAGALHEAEAKLVEYIVDAAREAYDNDLLSAATPYKCVFTGTRKRLWSSDDEHRPRAGYRSWLPIEPWMATLFADYNDGIDGVRRLATEVAAVLFRDNDALPHALFLEQTLGKTRVLSGQRDRRTTLHMLRDCIAYRLINKDVAFKLRKSRGASSTLAQRIASARMYSDRASIWKPSAVVRVYERALDILSRSTGAPPASVHVLALCGSWASPILAAMHPRIAPHVQSLLLVDVIADFGPVVERWLQPYASFRIDTLLNGGSEGAALCNDTSRHACYAIALWNPPYWMLEQYDMLDIMQRDNESGTERECMTQNGAQSTADRGESFVDWLQRFVRPSAANATRLLADNGVLCLVLPSAVRFQESFGKKPAWFNEAGMGRGGNHQYELLDFAERVLQAVQAGARDVVGCPLIERRRESKKFGNSTNREIAFYLQKTSLSCDDDVAACSSSSSTTAARRRSAPLSSSTSDVRVCGRKRKRI